MVRIFDLGTDKPIQINNDKDRDINNYEKAGLSVTSNDNTVIITETLSGVSTIILSEFYQNIDFTLDPFPSVRETVDTIQSYIDNVTPIPDPEDEKTLEEIAKDVEDIKVTDFSTKTTLREILQQQKITNFHLSLMTEADIKENEIPK